MEFKSTVEWEKSIKVAKMTQLKTKDGRTFFSGELGKLIKITLHKNTGLYGVDKKGNPTWTLAFIPVSYEKIEEKPANTDTSLGGTGFDDNNAIF